MFSVIGREFRRGPVDREPYTRVMAVSAADKAKMARLAADLREAETDEEPTPERRAAIIAAANVWRANHQIPPLREWWENRPEEEFYQRARALRMVRHHDSTARRDGGALGEGWSARSTGVSG